MVKRIILNISDKTLEKIYQYILASQPLPDGLVSINSHKLRHSIIIFYKKYGGDKTYFMLGFEQEYDLKEKHITRQQLQENFDRYCDLIDEGEIFIIDNELYFISIEVLNSLCGYMQT